MYVCVFSVYTEELFSDKLDCLSSVPIFTVKGKKSVRGEIHNQ